MSKALDGTALTIGIIGAVNWGLIGFLILIWCPSYLEVTGFHVFSMPWWDCAGCIF